MRGNPRGDERVRQFVFPAASRKTASPIWQCSWHCNGWKAMKRSRCRAFVAHVVLIAIQQAAITTIFVTRLVLQSEFFHLGTVYENPVTWNLLFKVLCNVPVTHFVSESLKVLNNRSTRPILNVLFSNVDLHSQ